MENEALDNKEYLKRLGARIRTIRKEKNLKQTEFGLRCDMDKQAVRRIELVGYNITIITLRKIADALEVEISEIFKDLK